jgi:hypothetical protein
VLKAVDGDERARNTPGPPQKGEEIWQAFEDNEVAASKQYVGQVVEVEGAVASIREDRNGVPWVGVVNRGGLFACSFGGRADEAVGKLRRGQRVQVSGNC